MNLDVRRGVIAALSSALLFGASTPLAKLLIGDVSALLLAGLMYFGSGAVLSAWLLGRRLGGRREPLGLARRDLPWLAGAVLAGGMVGPVLLMTGLAGTAAATASLLLNLEGVFTALLAWIVFREHTDRRLVLGMALIVAGGVILGGGSAAPGATPWRALAVVGACLAWGIDNNLTRRISGADAVFIAAAKGLAAGAVNIALALALGESWPHARVWMAAGAIGVFGYGVSLACFVFALRHLGTARTGAYFSFAPFAGALVAVLVLGEPLAASTLLAALLMAAGLYLHLSERHAHEHSHEELSHVHAHRHDAHHRHAHDARWDGREPHTHEHVHEPLVHRHPHTPDLHHPHRH